MLSGSLLINLPSAWIGSLLEELVLEDVILVKETQQLPQKKDFTNFTQHG